MKRKIKPFIFLFFVLTFILLFYFFPRTIVIKEIECKSQYGYCSRELIDLSSSLKNKKYNNVKKELNKYLSSNSSVSEYRIFYQPLSRFKLDVLIRKGVVLFKNSKDQSFYLIDSSGIVIAEINTENLGVIDIKDDLKVGDVVSDKHKFAVNIYQKMSILEKIETAGLEEDGFYIKLKDNPTVIFPLSGDVDVLVGSFVVVNNELNTDEQKIKIEKDKNMIIIDLRFKNPVVK